MSIFDGFKKTPNIHMRVMNKGIFWEDIDSRNGYTLQKHKGSNVPGMDHFRILTADDERVAWGTEMKMRSLFQELTEPRRGLQYGDVICVRRMVGLYDHYGIYESDNVIYEYAADSGDFGKKATVHITTLKTFMDNSKEVHAVVYPPSEKYTLYSPSDTIARARSKLGETKYNLVTNNCEHFAVWCKTGVQKSGQVRGFFVRVFLFPRF